MPRTRSRQRGRAILSPALHHQVVPRGGCSGHGSIRKSENPRRNCQQPPVPGARVTKENVATNAHGVTEQETFAFRRRRCSQGRVYPRPCHHRPMGMDLRFEIFPGDLDATVDFYTQILDGFASSPGLPDTFSATGRPALTDASNPCQGAQIPAPRSELTSPVRRDIPPPGRRRLRRILGTGAASAHC